MSLGNGPSGPRQSSVQAQLTRFGGRIALAVVAVGLLIIGLGYNGISGGGGSINGVPALVAQMPYLISGGVLGLAVVVLGAALMITQSAREDRVRLEAKLDVLIELQESAVGAVRTAAPSDAEGLFAAGTSSYHRPTCRLVDGREQTVYLTAQEALAQDLHPCRVCQPEASSSNVTIR